MKLLIKGLLLSGLVSFLATTSVIAQQISLDEFTHMTINNVLAPPGVTGADPSGGLMNWPVLIYTLPFAGVPGDVLIQDPFEPGSPILDVARFDGNFKLIFYSDSIDGYDSPGDTPGTPDPFLPNQVFQNELVSGNISYVDYTPGANDPGFNGSGPSYHFVSEGTVPEPGAALLLLSGLVIFGLARLRRRIGLARQSKRSV